MSGVNPTGKHRKQKRRHGEGSVPFLRRDHVRQRQYCCTLSLGSNQGRRIRKSFFAATQAEAERRRDDARRLLNLRLHPDALTMTVGNAMDRYLDTVRPPAVNATTYTRYQGRTLWPATVNYQVRKVLKKAGYPTTRIHDLRHAFATLLAAEGVHPRVAQDLLGHSTIGQSMEYTSVVPNAAREAAAMVNSALRRTS